MEIKSSDFLKYCGSIFRTSNKLFLAVFLLTSISCSKEEILVDELQQDINDETVISERGAKTSLGVAPYNNGYKKPLGKAKLQYPGSRDVKAEKRSFNNFSEGYFYKAKKNPKWMTFVNSKGSGKRCELRRLGEFSKTSGKKMSGKLKIIRRPKGEFTVLQLHFLKGKVPPLRIRSKNGKLEAIFREKDSKSAKVKKYNLGNDKGDKSFEVKVSDGKVSFKINGKGSSYSLKNWPSNGYYFKAGAYNQSSGTSEVRFQSLNW